MCAPFRRPSRRPLLEGEDPIALFEAWLSEAVKSEPNDANAMTLATVDADGLPDARMVLLKGVDATRLRLLHQYRRAPRDGSWPPTPRRRWCSTGNRCAARCGCAATVEPVSDGGGRRLFRHPRAAGADRRLGLGPVAAAARAASPWSGGSPRSA